MRTLVLTLITCSFLGSLASAASGVRIHRLSDPPLPPRSTEVAQRSSRSFSLFRRSSHTAPARREVAAPIAVNRTPEPPKPAPAASEQPRVTALPIATRPVAKTPAVVRPAAAATAASPVVTTPPVAPRHNITPAPAPIARPASEQPVAPRSNRPRRRLPIAPI